MRKGSIIPVVAIIFALFALALGSWMFVQSGKQNSAKNTTNTTVTQNTNSLMNVNPQANTNTTSTTSTNGAVTSLQNNCGQLSDYSTQSWARALDTQYNDVFIAYQGISERSVWEGSDSKGCLLPNQQLFVFIPEFFEFGCGYVLKYDIAKNVLTRTPVEQPTACADKFTSLTDEYVEYSGGIGDGGTGSTYTGKYYFNENRIVTEPDAQ